MTLVGDIECGRRNAPQGSHDHLGSFLPGIEVALTEQLMLQHRKPIKGVDILACASLFGIMKGFLKLSK